MTCPRGYGCVSTAHVDHRAAQDPASGALPITTGMPRHSLALRPDDVAVNGPLLGQIVDNGRLGLWKDVQSHWKLSPS